MLGNRLKQNYRRMAGICLCVLSLTVAAGCGSDKMSTGIGAGEQGKVVQWSENLNGQAQTFSVKQSPKRAISMSQATTEMMLALDLGDKMAGTAFKEEEIYEPLQKAYDKVPVLAEKWPSYEVFIGAKPDFTTGWATAFTKRGIEADKITRQNIPIWIPKSMVEKDATLDTFFGDMLVLGRIFNAEDKAKVFVDEQKKKLDKVQAGLKDLPSVTVFIFDSEDEQPFTVFEGYTTNLFKLINAKNVLSGQGVDKTWAKTTWETVAKTNPDYIIICDYGVSMRNTDDFDKKVARLKANPALANVTAVKEGRFLRVKLSEITPGVRSVDALERLAKEIHGK